ncbi:hypothetical protein ACJMK2_013753, partial [Sinanodonta woodiana]
MSRLTSLSVHHGHSRSLTNLPKVTVTGIEGVSTLELGEELKSRSTPCSPVPCKRKAFSTCFGGVRYTI